MMASVGHKLKIKYGLRSDPTESQMPNGKPKSPVFAVWGKMQRPLAQKQPPQSSQIFKHANTPPSQTILSHYSMLPKSADGALSLWAIWGIVSPVATFVLGFFVSRFSMTKAEKVSSDQAKYAVAADLSKNQNEAFQALSSAFAEYMNPKDKRSKPKLAEFIKISQASQNFLYQQRLVADAILTGRVDETSRDKTLIKSLKDTAERTIPKVYSTLRDIAEKHGLSYPSEFDRSDYESIFEAVEKYG